MARCMPGLLAPGPMRSGDSRGDVVDVTGGRPGYVIAPNRMYEGDRGVHKSTGNRRVIPLHM
eukprot:8790411-Prorocentrum_lima.AAC.1